MTIVLSNCVFRSCFPSTTSHISSRLPRLSCCFRRGVLSFSLLSAPRKFYAALLSREDRNELLMGVDASHADAVSRIIEQARRAADKWEVAHSDFLSPPLLNDALMALKKIPDVGVVASGGYPQADRCRLSVGHVEAMETSRGDIECTSVAALSVSGNFKFDPATHADFLGSIVNTGVLRDKVGDIIVKSNEGAQVLVVPELAGFICAALTQVRVVPVETTCIPLSAIQVAIPRKEALQTFEASLRVDAIASAGFRMSRSKLSELISHGALQVNWKEITKNGATLQTGDIVSLRGKGRIEVGDIRITKQGRYAVELFRYY